MFDNGIRIDYGRALAQADRLDEIAAEIERVANNEIDAGVESLKNAWKGEAASMYMEKGKDLGEKTRKTASDLKKAAEKLRSTARRIKLAEEAALAIVRAKG